MLEFSGADYCLSDINVDNNEAPFCFKQKLALHTSRLFCCQLLAFGGLLAKPQAPAQKPVARICFSCNFV